MAYIDQTRDSRRRATALAGVAVVHGALALGLLSFGVAVEREAPLPWNPFVLTPDPRPTPPPPDTAKPPEPANSVIVTPAQPYEALRPVDQVEVVQPSETVEVVAATDSTIRPADPPTPTPRPGPSLTPKDPAPANSPGSWIGARDYPARPLRDGVEGVAGYRLIVGSGGRVSSCEITQSTGNRTLDRATCRLLMDRARFEPATDSSGTRVMGQYSGKVRWEIPD